ncbi:MAG: CPBP family intramembrane glutamic endopeptidase [Candidatus Saccharibacteria bacterium]|nr:CPBP family intramembrane glutamic endopeptidase [Candidatus Saccharibacteria bacterium]
MSELKNTGNERDIKKPEKNPAKKPRTPVFGLTPITSVLSVLFIYFAAQVVAINIYIAAKVVGGSSSRQAFEAFQDSLLAQSVLITLIVALVFLMVWGLLKITATSWRQIGLNKPRPGYFGQALIGYGWYFLLFLSVTFIVGLFVPQVDLDQPQQLGFDRMATGASLWIIGFCLVILPAFYEEVLMRGVLFTGLRKKLKLPMTMLIVSLVFAAAHLEWGGENPLNWAAAIDTFALSGVLVYLREQSKSLWPAIFLHGIKNLVAFTLVFVFKVA